MKNENRVKLSKVKKISLFVLGSVIVIGVTCAALVGSKRRLMVFKRTYL